MDKKTFGIGVMMITAALLLIACLMPAQPAHAAFALKDRDYQMIAAQNQQGGDTLYVVDNRTGMVAVFAYDVRSKTLRPRVVREVASAFSN